MGGRHEERESESRKYSKSNWKTSTFRIRDREFLRWKKKQRFEKQDTISLATEMRVWTNATALKSTGARNASNVGDLLRRSDEKIAPEAIQEILGFPRWNSTWGI